MGLTAASVDLWHMRKAGEADCLVPSGASFSAASRPAQSSLTQPSLTQPSPAQRSDSTLLVSQRTLLPLAERPGGRQELLIKAIEISMASTWEKIRDFYDWAVENGDKRTEPWFLVYSPIPVLVTFIIYLLICKYGPKYMLSREPFNLKYILIVYNFALVGISAYIFWEFLVTSIHANYSYLCEPVDYSNSELGLRMANVCWWFFFSKVIELMDTVFFILRKKHNQVTFLHVYHHGTMIFNWWAGVKYVPGGQSFFIGMLNSFVHIVMYLYYGIAAMGPHMRKYLWWKRHLTMIQLLQFYGIAVHTSYNLFTDCDFPDGFNLFVFIYIITIIILFTNFYYKSYIQKKTKTA